ncbi:thymidine kinase [Aequorivita marina]|uniref:thymidine kinase n=1 Tax=Aequorivita marina TaxID=3073654 RepID=UPI002875DE74|nr:thymidine kinase [Aequorivita sp. S2608]MDS1298851.1 thymidine kinase [Aequorivita sp. S2608]
MFLENTVNQKEQFGWIEVICGSMFSGKSEELIRRLKRAKFARQKVEIFTPSIDTRYTEGAVTSHDSNQIRSTPVPAAANIPILADNCDVVGIDEAQFFDDEIVKVCNDLANRGVRVIVAGLDMDFKGNPFGPMPALMATAEYVTKVHAICTRTGNLANYSYRKAKSEDLVLLGETEEYEPLSRAAFFKAQLQDKVVKLEVNDIQAIPSEKQEPTKNESSDKPENQA